MMVFISKYKVRHIVVTLTFFPADLAEAYKCNSDTGNLRSPSTLTISSPTAPVAPTIPTLIPFPAIMDGMAWRTGRSLRVVVVVVGAWRSNGDVLERDLKGMMKPVVMDNRVPINRPSRRKVGAIMVLMVVVLVRAVGVVVVVLLAASDDHR